jgi:hypothetical protein
MTMPAFFSRVADSLRPVADVDPEALAQKLQGIRVAIELATSDPAAEHAVELACNLAARLYPRILIIAPDSETGEALHKRARRLILDINPLASVEGPQEPRIAAGADRAETSSGLSERPDDFGLRIGSEAPTDNEDDCHAPGRPAVTVDAHGWSVRVDPEDDPANLAGGAEHQTEGRAPGHPLAWLAASAIGMAEVFRAVFAAELGPRGRTGRQPGGFDLMTTGSREPSDLPGVDARGEPRSDIGEVFLIGAGAIGQAAVYALQKLPITGVLHAVDPETVTLSNLQRYLLTDARSVGAAKTDIVRDAFASDAAPHSPHAKAGVEVRTHRGRWGDRAEHLQADQVIVALDTARDRIAVASTMPRHAYNAWTQVADLGWSRHEAFGAQPCLACLYYPSSPRPSEHELIATAIEQPPLRVLAYLTYGVPIGFPLPGVPAVAELPAPPDAQRWTQVSLVEDLIAAGVISELERRHWGSAGIGALYRDGICAGGLLPVGELPGDVLVPLAHQSALAGIMLAAELLWSRRPEWAAARDAAVEHRYDVLRGFPQVIARPRQRTLHCLCSDPISLSAAVEDDQIGAGGP